MSEWIPLSDDELDDIRDTIWTDQSVIDNLIATIDALQTRVEALTGEREEYRTACVYENDYKLLAIRQRNAAQISLESVGELHKPDTVDVLPWKCVNGDCEHDDTECPEEQHQVCRECWNLWTQDGRDDECFYEDQVLWPCATARVAALANLSPQEPTP